MNSKYKCCCCCCCVASVCLTLCDPMDCSLPGSSVHRIFQLQEYWSGLPLPSPKCKWGGLNQSCKPTWYQARLGGTSIIILTLFFSSVCYNNKSPNTFNQFCYLKTQVYPGFCNDLVPKHLVFLGSLV